jgi:ActR/RegA family two-component response regulator
MTKNARILVVDDDVEFLEILERRLQRRGFVVTARTSCQDALKAAETQSFDAAVVDRSVPGGRELELVVRLASIQPKLPIVVLSGWNGQSFVDEALAAGAREYLAKPCSFDDINAALDRALESAGSLVGKSAR